MKINSYWRYGKDNNSIDSWKWADKKSMQTNWQKEVKLGPRKMM